MKKILFLSDVDISSSGGAQESMKIIMDELITDFEFYLIGPKGNKLNDNHIVLQDYNDLIVRGKSPIKLILLINKLKKEIKRINPDIIHVQMPSTLVLLNILLSLKLLNVNFKLIYTDRGVYGKYGRVTTASINQLVKKVETIVTTTEINKGNYERLYKDYDLYKEKFKVIPNTAGVSYENYTEKKRLMLKRDYNLVDSDFIIGFCGRYSEQKNWPLAHDIVKKLSAHRDIKFIIVLGTDGTETNLSEVNDYLQSIKNIVGEERLFDFVNITNKQMINLYHIMDAFVLTSKWESFGRTAIEAMANQNIVLATGVDGLTEVIDNKKFIFESANDAYEILEVFMKDRQNLIKAKNAFYERYLSHYGYQVNIREYKKVYEEAAIK